MKGLFPQYEPQTKAQKKELWDKAVFVFDANVLLNLYRYQSETSKQLLAVLKKLSNRIWIPHHAALEFQRNRVNVINDQNRKFDGVRSAVDKAMSSLKQELAGLQLKDRHSLIDPDPLLSELDKVANKFLSDLTEAEKRQQRLGAPDPLKKKIEDLFDGKMGPEPESQAKLDDVYKVAKTRYENEVPPGYKDANKGYGGSDSHLHNGKIYQRKFGDYLIWCQLLEHAKDQKIEYVVFVTDDSKDDWWWNLSSKGQKIIGPRPELIAEAREVGGIKSFWMYSPASFLKHASDFLNESISDETLEEVRDISRSSSVDLRIDLLAALNETILRRKQVESAVSEWLQPKFGIISNARHSFPRFLPIKNEDKIGFEILTYDELEYSDHLTAKFQKTMVALQNDEFNSICFIWVLSDLDQLARVESIHISFFKGFANNFHNCGRIKHVIGLINKDKFELLVNDF